MSVPDVYPLQAPEPRATLGYTGTHYYVLRVDANGYLALAPGGVNLRQYAATYRATGQATAGSGTIQVDLPAIAAGALVFVEDALCYLLAGSSTRLSVAVVSGGVAYGTNLLPSPVVEQACLLPNPVVLAPGENLRFYASAVGAGTTLVAVAVGYYVQA